MAAAFLGAASAAACAPLNPGYTAAEFDFYLADLDARAVIVPFQGESPVREVAQKRGIAVLELYDRNEPEGRVFALGSATQGSPQLVESPDPQAIALILHTSGTTSRPKMIRLSHANLCASAANIRSTLQLGESDRCLNVMPLFHIHGLVGALLSSLSAGGSVVCTAGFAPAHFFEWLLEFSPTWYTAVPTMHQEVLARAAANHATAARSGLRFIRSSSAALPPNVMNGIERAFGVPVIEAFGMTEASHQIASNPLPPARRKPGSVGLPGGCEVTIMDEQGQSLPRGQSGEIAIRGPSVTKGQPALSVDRPDGADAGWFRTGDVGHLDEDGYLFISGRLKEIINRGGEKIAPGEIDHVLMEHPAVGQAVTCAVPDARLGEDVVAVIVRRPGSVLTEREVREFASTRLAAFKVPRRVMFVDQIPKGPTGKIQRIGLAAKLGIESLAFAQPGASAPFAEPRTPLEMAIAEAWREVLEIDRVGLHDNFFELGGDSLAATEVITRVEARVGATIAIRDLGFGTLQQVAAGCDAQKAAGVVGQHKVFAPTRWARKVLEKLRSGK
jgi:acyl-CoA synthetase (AMP-forming)/AMP-acid ligase II/acyl carrier protein